MLLDDTGKGWMADSPSLFTHNLLDNLILVNHHEIDLLLATYWAILERGDDESCC
jgi:hypothetical protein